MAEPDINGAFETVSAARIRLTKQIDAIVKQSLYENELGLLDIVAILEDCKFRRMMDNYRIKGDDEDDEDEPKELR